MSSLAVESNYSNMTAARGRRRMVIRNPDNTATITHTTATAYTSNNNFGNSSLNKSNSNSNGNINGSNNSINNSNSPQHNNKMPSPNIIYNLKTGEGVVTCNSTEPSPSAMSASLALLNRIKSLETQKKKNNQLSSTAIKAAAAAANSAAISSTQLYGTNANSSYRTSNQKGSAYSQNYIGNYNISDQQNNDTSNNRSISPLASPNTERRSGKFTRQQSFSKSQEELNKLRVKSANPNVYKDKITDQKFFSRNFKVQSKSGSATSSQNNLAEQNHASIMRYLNDNDSDSELFTARNNNVNNNNNGTFFDSKLIKNLKWWLKIFKHSQAMQVTMN